MGDNLLKEISYLTRLIEQHKKKSVNNSQFVKAEDRKLYQTLLPVSVIERQRQSKYSYVKQSLPAGRVHLNPNFAQKLPKIHVNPRLETKPASVYVNPKMMKNFSNQDSNKISSKFNSFDKNPVYQTKIEPSVHVNPRLMKELSSKKEKFENLDKRLESSKIELKTQKPVNRSTAPTITRTVKINSPVIIGAKKSGNSKLISLSKRKLVRIRRSSKTGSVISPANPGRTKRFSTPNLRRTKVATKYKLVMEYLVKPDPTGTVPRSVKQRQIGSSKYKIDRTHIQRVWKRLSIGKSSTSSVDKKASGSMTGLVRIGGILYKSSRNQLVRSSTKPELTKRKRCIINVKGDRFVMASDGKKLRRLSAVGNQSGGTKCLNPVSRVDIGGMTFVEKSPNVLVRAHTKNRISTKAKQRSIQILRNKMRKNNQPCLIFQKFGYCSGQVKSTCHKLHDKKQVALCRNFLQGKCLLDNCPMSHSVCPEKMPTCKYFLEGCCIRDQCPYLHVKISSNTPICTQFLRGYCAKANKCEHRHVYVCPEFEKSGNCAKGKYCPYPHKSDSSECRKSLKVMRRKVTAKNRMISKSETDSSTVSSYAEDRKRYYDETGGTKEDFEKKRKTILKKIHIMQNVKIAEINGQDFGSVNVIKDNETTPVEISETNNSESDEESTCPKRAPLGPLPAYIPID